MKAQPDERLANVGSSCGMTQRACAFYKSTVHRFIRVNKVQQLSPDLLLELKKLYCVENMVAGNQSPQHCV